MEGKRPECLLHRGSFPYAGITLIRSVKGCRNTGISVPQDTPNKQFMYMMGAFLCQGNC